jgi:hypothetical protein
MILERFVSAANFLQEGPADTGEYFVIGYMVIFGTMALYLASLWLRRRNMEQDLEAIDQVREKGLETLGRAPEKSR